VYESRLQSETLDRLFDAVVLMEDREDCYRFFEDILTIGELNSMAQRFQVAEMLKNGSTYQQVVEATGASSATISRVNRCLHYGADGYNRLLERLEEKKGDG